ncbi:hypothetical protein pdam_00020506, partial [Pocillopora damicornis]
MKSAMNHVRLDLEFEPCQDHLPDAFLKADIKKHGKRHIILATDQLLEHLSKAKSWYIDGTFKLQQQLFTINAFVHTDDHAKQVPLVFILMSGRKKKDYHKIQELGLQQQYNNDRGTYQYLRQIMALAFLPEDEIEPMFEHLKAQAATDQLRQFVEYVSQTWIHNQTWPPSSWSVYMMAIRSNNDIEGWHHGLHRRASGKWHMPFYMLLDLLHQEARLTALRIRLVSEKKLKRIQRAKYRSLQAKVFALWDDFSHQRKNAQQLLRECARLNGPSRQYTQR